MRSFMTRERDRTQNRLPPLLIALLALGTRGMRALFLCRFPARET
jgi:hypothetical protein